MAALSDLAVLRALRLAGVCDPPGLATRLALDEDAARRALDVVVQRGHAEERPRGFALTETGREALADALAEERATVPPDAARRLYDAFGNHDRRFKAMVTAWQVEGRPRGASVQLAVFHDEFAPLLSRTVDAVPRLSPFPVRFDTALRRAAEGDDRYLLHPAVDSYHTIWFELHEELLHLRGTTREQEDAAGAT